MAHLINFDTRKGTHSFVSHAEKAWHGLGQIVDKAMTAEEAINLANLDYEVYKTTIHPSVDGTPNNVEAIEDKFAIMRKDNNAYLGLVGSRYEIVQNRDAFGFFDAIIDSGEAIFETAGALGKGERIFVTAKLPTDMLVGGEVCEKYIVLTNSHDGSSSIIAGLTTTRVVCNNTLQAALGNMSNKVSIQHRSGAKDKLAEAHKVMNIASSYMTEVEQIFNQMTEVKVDDGQLRKYITEVMRPANVVAQTQSEQEVISARFKNQVDSIYEFALTHPTQLTDAAKGTLWGAYNSISGYYNYIAKFRTDEDKFKSQMFGNGNVKINKGFKEALVLI
jgi:phage/plasmid-like protein (TIGR03299 family)